MRSDRIRCHNTTKRRLAYSYVAVRYLSYCKRMIMYGKSRSTVVVAGLIFGGEAFWRHDMKQNFSENMKTINSLTLLKVA